jgi:general secretion pathway protein K
LVVVLWVLAALAVIAAALSSGLRVEARVARNAVSLAEARALAEGAVAIGIARALATVAGSGEPWRLDGAVYEVSLHGRTLRVGITQESGRIDLNAADVRLLASLFASAGARADEAEAIADAIADFRDADDDTHLKGAETADYEGAGLPYPAKNAPFESVDELQQVLGVTPALFRAVRPAVTVFTGLPTVNPTYAPRAALLALPGVDRGEVEALLAARAENQYSPVPRPLPPLSGVEDWTSDTEIAVFLVRGEATLADGATFAREAVVWVPTGGPVPYWVLDWRQGPAP